MIKILFEEGKKFGKLTAISESERGKSGKRIWKCRCECGCIKNYFLESLRRGHSKSCGHSQKLEDKFLSHIEKTDYCWNWKGAISSHGYGSFIVDKKNKMPHRISYELFKGQIPEGLYVCHSCDNIKCVNPDHLFVGTQKDNMKDCINKKRMPKGEEKYKSKLTWEKVRDIRKLYKNPYNGKQLSKIYGVCSQHIYLILKNIKWKE
jgi:hypothetical protein